MKIKRFICSASVAVAVLASVAACGKSEETPAAAALDAPTVVASPEGTAPTPAVAGQAPTLRTLAIDRNALLRVSAAGKSIVVQAQQLQKAAETEFNGEVSRLQSDARAFQQQAAILAPAVKAQRQRELEARQTALQQKMQARGGQIQAGMNVAAETVARALEPILRQIMTEKHADILVDKQAIVLSVRDDIDVTALAVQRLDAQMKSVPVHLVNPQQAPRPGAAPAPVAPAPATAP